MLLSFINFNNTNTGTGYLNRTQSMVTEKEYLEMKEFNKEFEEGGVLGTNEVFKTYFNNLYKIQEYERENKRERVMTEHS